MGEPIRVLHIVSIMNKGGLETLLMNIYRGIDRNRIQFDFLVNREESGFFDEEIKALGGKIYNIPHIQKIGYKKHKIKVIELLKNHPEYYIIHAHVNTLNGLYLNLAKKLNIPHRITHSHNTNCSDPATLQGYCKKIVRKYSKLLISKSATDYFACSLLAAQWLYGKKNYSQAIIIKNGVNTENFLFDLEKRKQKRVELGIDTDTFLIGHIGSFTTQKNHIGILNIFNQISKKQNNATLCLAGDGVLKLEMEKISEKLGIKDKVKFLGLRNDISELLMAFDVLIFPSLYEGLPVVLVEAQATGLDCLISSNITNEIDLELGLITFIDIDNIAEWETKLLSKCDSLHEDILNRKSDVSTITLAGYDIKNTIDFLSTKYLSLVNQSLI